jgi:hypothetical protein
VSVFEGGYGEYEYVKTKQDSGKSKPERVQVYEKLVLNVEAHAKALHDAAKPNGEDNRAVFAGSGVVLATAKCQPSPQLPALALDSAGPVSMAPTLASPSAVAASHLPHIIQADLAHESTLVSSVQPPVRLSVGSSSSDGWAPATGGDSPGSAGTSSSESTAPSVIKFQLFKPSLSAFSASSAVRHVVTTPTGKSTTTADSADEAPSGQPSQEVSPGKSKGKRPASDTNQGRTRKKSKLPVSRVGHVEQATSRVVPAAAESGGNNKRSRGSTSEDEECSPLVRNKRQKVSV